MLFEDVLNDKRTTNSVLVSELFNLVITNQSHPNDALLVHENGFYNSEVHQWTTEVPMSPSP